MELQNLKQRLDLATRGHKLLEDKQDGLLRSFIDIIKKNNELRNKVEDKLTQGMQSFAIAKSLTHDKYLEEILAIPASEITLNIDERNFLSVKVPRMHFDYDKVSTDINDLEYGYLNSNSELDRAFEEFIQVQDDMLALAEIEKTAQLLADEIEKTRRRVNALEYSTIPDLEETIDYIEMKIDEDARAEKTRLMKIKDME